MKTVFSYIFSLVLFLIITIPANGQSLQNRLDGVYGLNPKLFNGRMYTNSYPATVKGHQFLSSKDFQEGSLEINQQLYEQQQINYDVYDQQLLLLFKDYTNASRLIEVPLSHVQSFILEGKYFELRNWEDSTYRIFQVIGEQDCKILIHWTKELKPITTTDSYQYQFSKVNRFLWIWKDNEYHAITNNKSFLKLFSDEEQLSIKKWLKSKRIKIQKTEDYNLLLLTQYIN
ncbi:MAG: hypothetical protein GQ527_00675 [Bacteroidales bacterium]|nr:hypothetical protein [Bacteroidales bacterium]